MHAVLLPLVLAATIVRAQTPAIGPPGGSLAGVVRDVAGAPLSDVNVTLLAESGAARTDSTGRFALRDVPPGNHTALFRRIGYRSVEYRWIAVSGGELQIAVAMTPVPRQLDRVVVEAPTTSYRRGTSSIEGSVLDSAGRAIGGADIRLLGGGLSTVTDSTGRFKFAMLAAGSYIVRARRQGLTSGNYVMQVAADDDRGITVKLFGLPKKTGARDSASASGYGVSDAGFDAFDRRERSGSGNPTLGPGDLFRANGAALDFVLQQYRDAESLPRRRSSIVAAGGRRRRLSIDRRAAGGVSTAALVFESRGATCRSHSSKRFRRCVRDLGDGRAQRMPRQHGSSPDVFRALDAVAAVTLSRWRCGQKRASFSRREVVRHSARCDRHEFQTAP